VTDQPAEVERYPCGKRDLANVIGAGNLLGAVDAARVKKGYIKPMEVAPGLP
jgi:hypothetical protein